ncbi:MAG TPA: hypothetical protein PKD12_04440 [Nitrospira sp.]|nr:hypothetical protein [Nitrospira sp.]
MITVKSPFVQNMVAAMTFVFVLGVLSMVWPVIIAIFLGILLLLQSLNSEPGIAALSWAEVETTSIVLGTLWRPGLSVMPSRRGLRRVSRLRDI